MPIAIYRLRKLNVAVPRHATPIVLNFAARWIRDVRLTRDPDGCEVVTVYFTSVQKRQKLVVHDDEIWQFRKGEFTIIHRQLRNGRLIREFTQPVGPLLNTAWCQHNQVDWVQNKLEEDQTARCIIEQYLYEFTPNPEDYSVVTFDFNASRPTLDMAEIATYREPLSRPFFSRFRIRPKVSVMEAAVKDKSESADVWMQLFEGKVPQEC